MPVKSSTVWYFSLWKSQLDTIMLCGKNLHPVSPPIPWDKFQLERSNRSNFFPRFTTVISWTDYNSKEGEGLVQPSTSTGDQERIPPNNINTITNRKVMRREKKISIRGFLFDQIPNSPNQHHKNCMAGSEENYSWDLGVQDLILI